ncbi:hypothetical protein DWY28_00115 [Ruminococcus sp. AF24-32LB]|nr:hypothetical protein DWY28_00115 [Ruminococcus sp. AF24-32LB]
MHPSLSPPFSFLSFKAARILPCCFFFHQLNHCSFYMKLKYEQSSVIFYNGTIAKIYVGFVNIQKKQKEILAKIDLTAFKFFHIIKFI